jgi:glutamate N-acetyltransferase/amino-acid N-acetyltransferase
MSTVLAVPGFLASTLAVGLKKNDEEDLALIYAPGGAKVAAVFTQSRVVAAPVIVSRAHVIGQRASALVINAGNANACTGDAGMKAALDVCEATADALAIEPDEVLIGSTGVIGMKLETNRIVDNVDALVASLSSRPQALADVAHAIMTTDLVAKIVSKTVTIAGETYTVTGLAKGSVMMAPNMATVICCVLTDAPLKKRALEAIWTEAIDVSLNCMTVDGDTSTNDTAVLMSSGAGLYDNKIGIGDAGYDALKDAITAICIELARSIARDGEGATKLVNVEVTGAATDADAKTVALAIANSPLVKTALFGNDANWGRVAMAAGRAGVAFDQRRMAITFGGMEVCREGTAVAFSESEALRALDQPEVDLTVDLGAGEGRAHVWTCDFSYDYVRINGEYRS